MKFSQNVVSYAIMGRREVRVMKITFMKWRNLCICTAACNATIFFTYFYLIIIDQMWKLYMFMFIVWFSHCIDRFYDTTEPTLRETKRIRDKIYYGNTEIYDLLDTSKTIIIIYHRANIISELTDCIRFNQLHIEINCKWL